MGVGAKDSVFFKGLGHWQFDQAPMSIWATQVVFGELLFGVGKCKGGRMDLGRVEIEWDLGAL